MRHTGWKTYLLHSKCSRGDQSKIPGLRKRWLLCMLPLRRRIPIPSHQNRQWPHYPMFQTNIIGSLKVPPQVYVEVDPRALCHKIALLRSHRNRVAKAPSYLREGRKINQMAHLIIPSNLVEGDLATLIQVDNLEVVAWQEVVDQEAAVSLAYPVTRTMWKMLSITW